MHLHHAADTNWRILEDLRSARNQGAAIWTSSRTRPSSLQLCYHREDWWYRCYLHTTADGSRLWFLDVLNGEKWLISHTDCSDYTYVICSNYPDEESDKDSRLSAFLVPTDNQVSNHPYASYDGLQGAGHAGLKFTNLNLTQFIRLAKRARAWKSAIHSLSVSRVHIACSNLGMAQRMLEMPIP